MEIPDGNLNDPHGYLVGKGYSPATQGFSKGEGIVATPDGKGLIFAESGTPTSSNAGRVWKFTDLTAAGLRGSVIAEGSFDTIGHPDNVRFTPSGDLLILEDNGSALGSVPATGGMNGIWVLPKGKTGTANARLFATLPFGAEPTRTLVQQERSAPVPVDPGRAEQDHRDPRAVAEAPRRRPRRLIGRPTVQVAGRSVP